MKRAYSILGSLLIIALLAACSGNSADPIFYDTVSEPVFQAGDAIPAPAGDPFLTVEGKISNTNVGDTAQFDLETLESLGLVSYDVDDPFAGDQNIVFTGVLISDILDAVGADPEATALELVALNDYAAPASIEDARRWSFMFALQADGTYIPLDDGGPAKIVIPFNDFPDDLDHVTYDAQWVWSMTRIVVK